MKLTVKIFLMYMVAMALFTAYVGFGIVRREHEQLKEEMREEAESIGFVMSSEIVGFFQQEQSDLSPFIESFNSSHGEMSVNWIPKGASPKTLMGRPGSVAFDTESADKHQTYYPIQVFAEHRGWLEFSQPLDEVHGHMRGTMIRAGTLILGMLLCGGAFILMGIRGVGQRLEKLTEKTKRIGQGDFSTPLQLRGNDELNQLATALNEMSDQLAEQQEEIRTESTARLAAVEQLRHVDRLNTVGRLASGVAHELGTPLNVVSGRADLIASGRLDADQTRESALAIKSEADRMTNIIRQLLDFARRGTSQRSSIDFRHVADQCAELLRSMATKQNVQLVVNGEGPLMANVDPAQMQQVLTNLVVNSIQAMPAGGTVSIELEHKSTQPPGAPNASTEPYCCLSVSDEGVGISAEDRQHLFEPFFTTKDVGEGTGLGLSVSYGIVQDHDGWIVVQSVPGRGSRFTVFLPSNESSVNDAATSTDCR